jgi:hypothetical protein
MKETSCIQVPRCVLEKIDRVDVRSVELHGFADASYIAYGANVYLVVTISNGVTAQLLV